MPVKSIWDYPKPAKTIGQVYDENATVPGENRPELESGTGIVQGNGLTVTNARPAAAAAMPAMPGQPAQPRPIPKLKPVNLPTTDEQILQTPGHVIVQGARDLLDNIVSMDDYLTTNGGVMPSPVAPAGQPVMPGQPQAVQQPLQPSTAVTGQEMGLPPQPAGQVAPGATVDAYGRPVQTMPDTYTPPPAKAPGAIQQPVQPAQPWPKEINASSQLAGQWLSRATPVAKNPDGLLAMTNEFLTQHGPDAIERLDKKNPIKQLFDAYKAKPEGDGTKAAEMITGKESEATRLSKSVNKAEIAMEKEAEDIRKANARSEEKAANEQKAQWRTMASTMEADVRAIETDKTNYPDDASKASAIRQYFDNLEAMNYPMDKLRGKAKAIWSRVQKARYDGTANTADIDRAYYTGPTPRLESKQETELMRHVAKKIEGAVDPNTGQSAGGMFPIRTTEDFIKKNPGTNAGDFEKAIYSGTYKGQPITDKGKALPGMEARYAEFVKTVEANIKSQTFGEKNAEKRKKLLAEADGIALELWTRSLQDYPELHHAWIMNHKDKASDAARTAKTPSPNQPAPQPAQVQPPAQISNDADFDRLPSGAEFVGPDGKKYRKK